MSKGQSTGFVPSAYTIGVAAPLRLLTLRVLHGSAVGGEWAGAALLSAEYAPTGKCGTYGGMFTELGVGAGLLLSNNRQGFLDIWGTCLYFADDVLNQGARRAQPLVRRPAPLLIPA